MKPTEWNQRCPRNLHTLLRDLVTHKRLTYRRYSQNDFVLDAIEEKLNRDAQLGPYTYNPDEPEDNWTQRCPQELHDRLTARLTGSKWSQNQFVNQAIREKVERETAALAART